MVVGRHQGTQLAFYSMLSSEEFFHGTDCQLVSQVSVYRKGLPCVFETKRINSMENDIWLEKKVEHRIHHYSRVKPLVEIRNKGLRFKEL